MTDNENSTSSYVMLNNDLFLYAFVDCSTDIEVVITELLEYMAVHAKVNRSLPFTVYCIKMFAKQTRVFATPS